METHNSNQETHSNKQDKGYRHARTAANTYIYTICYAETMTSITQPDVQSIGIQCNLLAAPPLRKIQYKEEESLPSEVEETDLDTSFCVSQEDTTTE